jgi:hypothetical protein
MTLIFEKNANFLAENWRKLQKIVIITSTPYLLFSYTDHGTCVCPSSAGKIDARCDHYLQQTLSHLAKQQESKGLPDYWQAQWRSPSLNPNQNQFNVKSATLYLIFCLEYIHRRIRLLTKDIDTIWRWRKAERFYHLKCRN